MTVYNDEEKREIFFAVGTCLHLILDYAERVRVEANSQDKKIISAFRYANNSLKHSIEVKGITEEIGGFEFQIKFPFESSVREVIWSSTIDGKDKRWENQRENYKKFLEGKNVNETCNNVIEMLEKCKIKNSSFTDKHSLVENRGKYGERNRFY